MRLKFKCIIIFCFIATHLLHSLFSLARIRYAKSKSNSWRDQEIGSKDFSRVRGMGTAVYVFLCLSFLYTAWMKQNLSMREVTVTMIIWSFSPPRRVFTRFLLTFSVWTCGRVNCVTSQMSTHCSFLVTSYRTSCTTQLLNFQSFARSKHLCENRNITNNYIQRLLVYFYWSAIPRHFHYQGMDRILQGM